LLREFLIIESRLDNDVSRVERPSGQIR